MGEALQQAIEERARDEHAEERRELAKWFVSRGGPIDYERYAEAFAVAYLLPNYWKAAHALLRARPGSRTKVVDLGCGSGAAAWAALAWHASEADADESIELLLVDRSRRSLSLAEELGERVLASLPSLRYTIRVEHAELDAGTEVPSDSLILLSHVLTEHRNSLQPLLSSAARERAGGQLLIIERHDDDVWIDIDAAADSLHLARDGREWNRRVETLVTPSSHKAAGLRTRWMLLSRPETSSVVACVVARYFDAWRRQDVNRLNDVFAAEAKYMYDPFSAPLVGREAIMGYWRREVLSQQRPTVLLDSLTLTASEGIVEWTACFERENLSVEVRGMMVLRVDPDEERVVELREYYRTSKQPMGSADVRLRDG